MTVNSAEEFIFSSLPGMVFRFESPFAMVFSSSPAARHNPAAAAWFAMLYFPRSGVFTICFCPSYWSEKVVPVMSIDSILAWMSAGWSTAYQMILAFVFFAISSAWGDCLFSMATAFLSRFRKRRVFAARY